MGFEGIVGKYDPIALRHGFQVYQEVCASCHSMDLIKFRNLEGMGYSENTIKAFASESAKIIDGPNDDGEMFERIRIPSDPFPNPFDNEKAARLANNGAYPVDLSLIAFARHNGPDYIFSLLAKGYDDKLKPKNFEMYPGLHYNAYFPVEQMAMDVTEFLFWASDPHLENRKNIGIQVMIF